MPAVSSARARPAAGRGTRPTRPIRQLRRVLPPSAAGEAVRNISFALTTEQIRKQTKTVTRRLGWDWLNAGTLLQPVVKGQGIPKGGKVERIGAPIRVTRVSREPLTEMLSEPYGTEEAAKEGFPEMKGWQFVAMFQDHNGMVRGEVTRIEFEYTEPVS